MKYDISRNPFIDSQGDRFWYNEDGELHREDEPAVIRDDYKAWVLNDKLHRLDGPAIEYPNGDKCWYLDDKRIDVSSQKEFEQYLRLKAFI